LLIGTTVRTLSLRLVITPTMCRQAGLTSAGERRELVFWGCCRQQGDYFWWHHHSRPFAKQTIGRGEGFSLVTFKRVKAHGAPGNSLTPWRSPCAVVGVRCATVQSRARVSWSTQYISNLGMWHTNQGTSWPMCLRQSLPWWLKLWGLGVDVLAEWASSNAVLLNVKDGIFLLHGCSSHEPQSRLPLIWAWSGTRHGPSYCPAV